MRLIGKCPADVVMAADVVNPCSVVGQVVAVGQCLMEQVDFARGKRVPQQCHLQWVVADLAFILADVLDNLVGVDNGFGFEEHGRGGNTHDGVKRTNQSVCLRQVFAACAICFQIKATASMRRISTPKLARNIISPAIARNTQGLL